jgi:hypothetical protein
MTGNGRFSTGSIAKCDICFSKLDKVVLDYQGSVAENLVHNLVGGKGVILHICLRDSLNIYLTGEFYHR